MRAVTPLCAGLCRLFLIVLSLRAIRARGRSSAD